LYFAFLLLPTWLIKPDDDDDDKAPMLTMVEKCSTFRFMEAPLIQIKGGAVTTVGWQITLCDPIDRWRPVVLR